MVPSCNLGKVLPKVFSIKSITIIIIPNWLLVPWDLIQATFVLEIKPQESNLPLTHKPLAMYPLSKQLDLLDINSIQDGSFRGCSRTVVGPKGTLPKMYISYKDKTLHGYKLPKEDQKNIWITRHSP